MSFFKKFGGGKKAKGKESEEADEARASSYQSHSTSYSMSSHSKPRQSSSSSGPISPTSPGSDEVFLRSKQDTKKGQDEDFELPPSFNSGKKERNMSISRSGRHKYRNKQRGSVLKNEVYSQGDSISGSSTSTPPVSPTSPSTSNSATASSAKTKAIPSDKGKTTSVSSTVSKTSPSGSTQQAASQQQQQQQQQQQPQQRGSLGRANGASANCRESESTAHRLSNERRVARPTAV